MPLDKIHVVEGRYDETRISSIALARKHGFPASGASRDSSRSGRSFTVGLSDDREDLSSATSPLPPGALTTSEHSDERKIETALSAGPAASSPTVQRLSIGRTRKMECLRGGYCAREAMLGLVCG